MTEKQGARHGDSDIHAGDFMTFENQTVFVPEEAQFQGKTKPKRQTGEGSLHPSIIPFFD